MGSYAPEAADSRDEINVLITGFGPFLGFDINPSYLIASTLPKILKRVDGPQINIHTQLHPIQVSYQHVRSTVPELIFSNDASQDTSPSPPASKTHPRYDIVLHIGMAYGRDFYTLETQAHRDGYTKKDIHDRTMADDKLWKEDYQSPEVLHTGFDAKDVWRRWKAGLMDEDLRPSNDPGRYLCDFIYYTSMVEYWRHDRDGGRPVMFLHVPAGCAEEDLERGRRVAVGLIEALVGNLVKGGK